MAIYRTWQEAIKKICTTRPANHIETFLNTLFPESTLAACQRLLLENAIALFKKQWTATQGAEVQVHAYVALDLLDLTASEWRAGILRVESSASLASELQA